MPRVTHPLDPTDRPTPDRYQWMVESVREVIFEADPEGRWTYLNPAWTRVLGHDVEGSIGRQFLDYVHPDDREANLAVFVDTVTGGKDRCRFEARYLTADGGVRHMEIHAWIFRGPTGEPLGSTGTLTDVTERRIAEAELERRATHDALTGLPNRTLLCTRIADAVDRSRRLPDNVALLFLDLDRFKLVNDSLGHDAGDEVLRAVADRLRRSVRPTDLVGRFGGDEFAVLAEGLDRAGARTLAHRVRAAVGAPLVVGDHELALTASVGVRAVRPGDSLDTDAEEAAKILLRDADSAMYEAKEAGRDRTEVFDTGTRARVVARLDIETLLRKALDHDGLLLHYQPQIDLRTGAVVGLEALLRWDHPVTGVLAPDEFIAVAEDSGLIVPIGRWVLEQVCVAIADRRARGVALPRIAVNVSARQLASGLVADVAAVLQHTGAPPDGLCLELTESALLTDSELALASMSALTDLGVALSLDDFGTGFSSLSYLQRLPLRQIKIDRSFVARLDRPEGRAIVTAIIGLADALGIATIAEGVERPSDAAMLDELGCRVAQGYWLGRPGPLDEALAGPQPDVLPSIARSRV